MSRGQDEFVGCTAQRAVSHALFQHGDGEGAAAKHGSGLAWGRTSTQAWGEAMRVEASCPSSAGSYEAPHVTAWLTVEKLKYFMPRSLPAHIPPRPCSRSTPPTRLRRAVNCTWTCRCTTGPTSSMTSTWTDCCSSRGGTSHGVCGPPPLHVNAPGPGLLLDVGEGGLSGSDASHPH